MAWTTLCELEELNDGEGKYVEIGGFHLAVFLDRGSVFAMDSSCPHAGANLAAGYVQDGCAVCPRHAWAFRLTTGQLGNTPGIAITTYPVRLFERPENKPMLVQADLPIY